MKSKALSNTLSGKLLDLDTQRQFAKGAMSVSLGVLVLSAFGMKNKTVKKIHIAAGVSMVVFSVYHAGLYDNGIFKKMILKQARKTRNKATLKE